MQFWFDHAQPNIQLQHESILSLFCSLLLLFFFLRLLGTTLHSDNIWTAFVVLKHNSSATKIGLDNIHQSFSHRITAQKVNKYKHLTNKFSETVKKINDTDNNDEQVFTYGAQTNVYFFTPARVFVWILRFSKLFLHIILNLIYQRDSHSTNYTYLLFINGFQDVAFRFVVRTTLHCETIKNVRFESLINRTNLYNNFEIFVFAVLCVYTTPG